MLYKVFIYVYIYKCIYRGVGTGGAGGIGHPHFFGGSIFDIQTIN